MPQPTVHLLIVPDPVSGVALILAGVYSVRISGGGPRLGVDADCGCLPLLFNVWKAVWYIGLFAWCIRWLGELQSPNFTWQDKALVLACLLLNTAALVLQDGLDVYVLQPRPRRISYARPIYPYLVKPWSDARLAQHLGYLGIALGIARITSCFVVCFKPAPVAQ
jgi:hypothetical protein